MIQYTLRPMTIMVAVCDFFRTSLLAGPSAWLNAYSILYERRNIAMARLGVRHAVSSSICRIVRGQRCVTVGMHLWDANMGSTARKLSSRHRQNVIHRCGWVLNYESIIPEDTTSSIVVILLICGGPNSTISTTHCFTGSGENNGCSVLSSGRTVVLWKSSWSIPVHEGMSGVHLLDPGECDTIGFTCQSKWKPPGLRIWRVLSNLSCSIEALSACVILCVLYWIQECPSWSHFVAD